METLVPPSPIHQIFAVDDVSDNLFLLEAMLGDEAAYSLSCFERGSAALEAIAQNPPALILLDVMMPEMDGYEVTRRIRANPNLPYIPILLITAHDATSVVEGLDAGADDFIRKPVSLDELKARVRSLLRLKTSIDNQTAMMRQQDDFVARLTHDLRTPLVAANRVLQLCVEGCFGNISTPLEEMLSNVIQNNDNLLKMANTLLEVYRHDAGQKEMAFSRVKLLEVAEEVVKELEPLAQEKSLTLKLCVGAMDEEDSWVWGDRLELRRVITNLIGNAIKFSDAGGIELRYELQLDESQLDESQPGRSQTDQAPAEPMIAVVVADTGPGIPLEEQQKIFERFRQGEHMRAGSGLGLHLTQRIVEAHQGQISLSSQPGDGSTFTVLLPIHRQSS